MTEAAARMRRLRERRAAGLLVLQLEVPEHFADVLVQGKYLAPCAMDDPVAVRDAAQRMIADLTAVDILQTTQ